MASTALQLYALPRNPIEIEAAKVRSRKRLTRTAAIASAASIIPLPGIDIAVDAGALLKLIPEINREFGLTPDQIEQLSPNKQLIVAQLQKCRRALPLLCATGLLVNPVKELVNTLLIF